MSFAEQAFFQQTFMDYSMASDTDSDSDSSNASGDASGAVEEVRMASPVVDKRAEKKQSKKSRKQVDVEDMYCFDANVLADLAETSGQSVKAAEVKKILRKEIKAKKAADAKKKEEEEEAVVRSPSPTRSRRAARIEVEVSEKDATHIHLRPEEAGSGPSALRFKGCSESALIDGSHIYIKEDEHVQLLETSEDGVWAQVRCMKGEGWVRKEYLQSINPKVGQTFIHLAGDENYTRLRTCAEEDAAFVDEGECTASPGELVEFLQESSEGTWVRIQCKKGSGWVRSGYIQEMKSCSDEDAELIDEGDCTAGSNDKVGQMFLHQAGDDHFTRLRVCDEEDADFVDQGECTASPGEQVQFLQESTDGKWVRIQCKKGSGWMRSQYLHELKPQTCSEVKMLIHRKGGVDYTRLRDCADEDADFINEGECTARPNEKVQFLEESKDGKWVRIQCENGSGWVRKEYVEPVPAKSVSPPPGFSANAVNGKQERGTIEECCVQSLSDDQVRSGEVPAVQVPPADPPAKVKPLPSSSLSEAAAPFVPPVLSECASSFVTPTLCKSAAPFVPAVPEEAATPEFVPVRERLRSVTAAEPAPLVHYSPPLVKPLQAENGSYYNNFSVQERISHLEETLKIQNQGPQLTTPRQGSAPLSLTQAPISLRPTTSLRPSPSLVALKPSEPSTSSPSDARDADAPTPPKKHVPTESEKAMDKILEECFLQAVTTRIKDRDVPIMGTTLYGKHMRQCRRVGTSCDVKDSSFVWFREFLQDLEKRGVLTLNKEMQDPQVTRIFRNHALIRGWQPWPNHMTMQAHKTRR